MIGVFDSGLGGLTVLEELVRDLPQYSYIYLGDCARAPYGNKSQDLIFEYTRQGVEFLFKKGCGLVILACNTASAEALRRIQQEWLGKYYPQKRVLGVIIPSVEELKEKVSGPETITGIIGTRATIESGAYQKEIKKNQIETRVIAKATPLLVPLVEEGLLESKISDLALRRYLRPLKDAKINYLILACTHYPFLEKSIKRIMGKKTEIISTPRAVAKRFKDYLSRHQAVRESLKKQGLVKIYATDNIAAFQKAVKKRFSVQPELKKIDLRPY